MKAAGSLALVAVIAALAAPGGSAAGGDRFIVPSGTHVVTVHCAGTAPLADLRFVLAGPAQLQIVQILGSASSPELNFPDVSPHQVTAFFAQHPIASESGSFDVLVKNPLDRAVHLTIRCV